MRKCWIKVNVELFHPDRPLLPINGKCESCIRALTGEVFHCLYPNGVICELLWDAWTRSKWRLREGILSCERTEAGLFTVYISNGGQKQPAALCATHTHTCIQTHTHRARAQMGICLQMYRCSHKHTEMYRQTRHEYLTGFSLHVFHICHYQCLQSWFQGRGLMSRVCVYVREWDCVCVWWWTQSSLLHISRSSSLPRALLLSSVRDEHPQDLTALHPLLCVCVCLSE